MRYLPLTKTDRAQMLEAVGVKNINELYNNVPQEARGASFNLPNHQGEIEVERILTTLANKNQPAGSGPFFIGGGCYNHHVPATVDHIIQRSEFLTAYTPYQPEIAQGTLTAIFEYQTMIANSTGMDVANASMYDGATSVAEAALMAKRIKRKGKINYIGNLNPQYLEVLQTYISNFDDMQLVQGEPDADSACVIIQNPDYYGNIQGLADLRTKCDEVGALLVVAVTEFLSLGLLPAPGEADIVAGEAQSIGVPMSYGGPHLGFFACKQQYLRQMPGRLCGETVDKDGRRSFVLTLNTREQHIRREKATSNICTNQGLFALAFTIHMALLGEHGFKKLAKLNHKIACNLADELAKIPGISIVNKTYFNEFLVQLPTSINATELVNKLANQNIFAGLAVGDNQLLLAATEMVTEEHISQLVAAIKAEV